MYSCIVGVADKFNSADLALTPACLGGWVDMFTGRQCKLSLRVGVQCPVRTIGLFPGFQLIRYEIKFLGRHQGFACVLLNLRQAITLRLLVEAACVIMHAALWDNRWMAYYCGLPSAVAAWSAWLCHLALGYDCLGHNCLNQVAGCVCAQASSSLLLQSVVWGLVKEDYCTLWWAECAKGGDWPATLGAESMAGSVTPYGWRQCWGTTVILAFPGGRHMTTAWVSYRLWCIPQKPWGEAGLVKASTGVGCALGPVDRASMH